MEINKIKKVLSSALISAFLTMYAAPAGMCINTPVNSNSANNTQSNAQVNLAVQKPVLRTPSTSDTFKLEGDITLSKANPKISLSLRDSDVKQVLRMFADKAGLNIIFHDSVAGKVTLDLVNVPLNDAFKMVLQVTDLTYFVDKNTMVVASSSAAAGLNLAKEEMFIIPVKYVDAAVMADFLNKNIFTLNRPGLSNSNIVITNPATNELLVFGTDNDAKMAKKIVSQFDKKPVEQTYVVNHTTPKEMTDMLCKTLFQSEYSSSSSGGASASNTGNPGGTSAAQPNSPPPSPASGKPSSAPSQPKGVPTGAAADAGSGSSSSSSSGGGSGSSASFSSLSLGTGVIACQYNNSVAANTLGSMNVNNLVISYFPERGTISVLGGSDAQRDLIQEFITKYDKKQPQAYLEVSVIELNETGQKSFDNTWQVWSSFFSGYFNGQTVTNPLYPNFFGGDQYTIPGVTTTSVSNGVSTTTTTPATIISKFTGSPMATYAMSYLIQNGKGRVLANPKIMITNGKQSKIVLTDDYLSSVTQSTTTTTTSSVTTYTYNIASDDGVTISLTPYISPDGYVTLDIHPVYKSIKGTITGVDKLAGMTVATLLDNRDIDLKSVRIKDGETLTIGGMIKESEQKNVSKIPVLGDLPAVGMFFRNTDSKKTKLELVIMITPKIIQDTEDVVSKPNATL